MKICQECIFSQLNEDDPKHKAICTRAQSTTRDVYDGEIISRKTVIQMRKANEPCGPSGRLHIAFRIPN